MAIEKTTKKRGAYMESDTCEVILKKDHTHKGANFHKGATLTVSKDTKKFLADRNII